MLIMHPNNFWSQISKYSGLYGNWIVYSNFCILKALLKKHFFLYYYECTEWNYLFSIRPLLYYHTAMIKAWYSWVSALFLLILATSNTCANVQKIQVLFKPVSLFSSQRPEQTQHKHHHKLWPITWHSWAHHLCLQPEAHLNCKNGKKHTKSKKDVKTTKVNANGQGISQTPQYEIQTYWWKCAQENTFTLSPCFLLQTHTQNVIIINNMCMMIQITVNTPWMHKSIVRTLIGRLRAALLPSHQQWPKPVRTPHWPSNSNWVKKHKWLTKCSNSASQLQKANKKWVNRLTLPLSLWQQ